MVVLQASPASRNACGRDDGDDAEQEVWERVQALTPQQRRSRACAIVAREREEVSGQRSSKQNQPRRAEYPCLHVCAKGDGKWRRNGQEVEERRGREAREGLAKGRGTICKQPRRDSTKRHLVAGTLTVLSRRKNCL